MKQFLAHGIVRDEVTKEPIPGLRVEAWDKDLIFDDLVGSAYSDEKGYFRMIFDESYFKELFLDRYPDIYFRLFQGNMPIKDTKNSILWNAGKSEGGAYMEIEIDASQLEPFSTDTRFGEKSSTRAIYQATYTPRKATSQEQEQAANTARGVEKGAFIASLHVQEEEVERLLDKLTASSTKEKDTSIKDPKLLRAMEIISAVVKKGGKGGILQNAGRFSTIDLQTLQKFANALLNYREEVLKELEGVQEKILEKHRKTDQLGEESGTGIPPFMENALALWDWGQQHKAGAKAAEKGRLLAKALNLDPRRIGPNRFVATAKKQLQRLREYSGGLRGILEKEPVGYLHLEKMSFTPAGIERGELAYSLPLAPGEEVNIAHKEWSYTEEEFERIVTDYMEEFSEEGVAEKSEFAQAVNSQSQHSSAFNVGVTASGSYAGFSISSSFGYNASESSSKSQQSTRNQAYDITQKASSRTKKEHKISFKVASAAETEDQTVRKIKNPYQDKPVRIDYYQLIRKWQVNLFREGIRLTWDMAVPEPGSGLLSKIQEIARIRKQLEEEFELKLTLDSENPPADYEVLNEDNYDVQAAKYGALVEPPLCDSKYVILIDKRDIKKEYWDQGESKERKFFFTLNEDSSTIPDHQLVEEAFLNFDEFEPTSGDIEKRFYVYVDSEPFLEFIHTQDDFNFERHHGQQNPYIIKENFNKIPLVVTAQGIESYYFELYVKIKCDPKALQEWKLGAFKSIYDAAQSRYYENRQKLKEKLARLEEELGEQDALSLRKKEREEVMKGILRWIGIENFEFFPEVSIFENDGSGGQSAREEETDIEDLYDPKTGLLSIEVTEDERRDILRQGEIIKFLHHAIEWENMLYFLYPYFWTHPTRWEFKKYLNHPDPLHQAFLKAGSARVILTIRPGFEDAFLSFINKGPESISELPPHPYLSIGEEFKNHSKTNFPGIPAANPITNYRPLLYPRQQKAWGEMQHIMKLLEEYRKRPLPEQRQAWRDMKVIMEYLERYRQDKGVYPTNWGALIQYFPPDEPIPDKDPWDNNFHYEAVRENADDPNSEIVDYKLASWGADGQEGGEDEDADITSWSEPEGGEYPNSLHALKQSFAGSGGVPEEEVPLEDPWGHPYDYDYPGKHGDYDLVSYGANGWSGGEGEEADITSWAEASLIGQWFEYTPTSAMDISLDQSSNEI